MKIRIIRPVTSNIDDGVIEEQFRSFASSETQISAKHINGCPKSIESRADVGMAIPGVMKAALIAESERFDACIINCFADPGVTAAREIVKIPVVGPGESSLLIGAMLGVTIGIITVTSELIPLIEESARAIGISSKIVSIRAVDIPVLELDDKSRLIESFIRESIDSIREGAHVIIAGCTGMVGLAREVKNSLMARGYDVPIVDPQGAAMVCAEGLVRLSTYHSSLSYSRPSYKESNDDVLSLHICKGEQTI